MSRNNLSQSTLEAVAAFYKNDEYSRVMPSKSDCVMLQEILILCNLEGTYFAF